MTGLEIQHKREFHPWRWLFLLILIGLVTATGWYAYRWYSTGEEPPLIPTASADPRIDQSDVSSEKIDSYTVPGTHPRYVTIAKLGIKKVRVQQVGVTSSNQLDMPKNINDAGWYGKSSTPGSGRGAVLIDAHAAGLTKNGVFIKLKTLERGDQIGIERGDGQAFTYVVVENKSMAIQEVNTTGMKKMVQSIETDKEGLSLITNDGKWIPKYQQFDRRIMLRAVLVE